MHQKVSTNGVNLGHMGLFSKLIQLLRDKYTKLCWKYFWLLLNDADSKASLK
jgi:hypothetical protein